MLINHLDSSHADREWRKIIARNLHRMQRRLLRQRSDAIALTKDGKEAKLKIHASISAVVHMGDMKD